MNNEKIWDRPWSSKEIIDNSDNWSLAGDAALLNTLKAFANNLLTKTDVLNDNINNLLHNLDEVVLKLDISQNEFQSLKNTQFIESRVYDDDETLDSKENEKVPKDLKQETSDEKDFNANLNLEIELLGKYYDMVEISISDSEDESEKSFMLKPKDMYESRQLPPLIGSDEWYKNWYMEDETSDVDSQKSSEVYSNSDSDDNLPKDLFNGSETSSELDFSHHANESRPVANSTFKESVRKTESITSNEGSEEFNSLPAKAPISNKVFAEQLAAKLGCVISKEENLTTEVNTKPIQAPKTDAFSAGLFSNEPPPLSDPEDKTMKGIFSGGRNLFDKDDDEDDDDDAMFWDNQKKIPVSQHKKEAIKSKADQNDDDVDVLKRYVDNKNDLLHKSSQVSKGLFDSDNSDDDLFASKPPNINKPAFLQPTKLVVPLFDDEPPLLDNEKNQEKPLKKKPVGGVSILGNQNIGDILKNRQRNNNKNAEDTKSPLIFPNKETPKPKDELTTKKISLFDDDDEDLFSKMDNKPKTKKLNLFDDDIDNNNDVENKKTVVHVDIQVATKKPKLPSLFDDDDDEESNNEDDIFANINKSTSASISAMDSTKNISLFGDDDEINQKNSSKVVKNKNLSLFDDDDNNERDLNEEKSKITNSVNIFDDFEDASDPLLADTNRENNNNSDKNLEKIDDDDRNSSANLLGGDIKNTVPQQKSKKISLFDDNDDDDDDDEDLFSNVSQKLNFKLFEDPESAENMFDIKKPATTEDVKNANVKNAEIRKTSEMIQKSDGVTIVDDGNDVAVEEKLEIDPVQLNLENDKVDENNVSVYKESKQDVSSLFDEEVIKTNEEFNFPEGTINAAKTPSKPQLFTKPSSPLPTNRSDTAKSPPIDETTPPAAPSRPVISLFESSPPPDDDDWDAKSDNFSDTEDFAPYRAEENSHRSNLFDNEPPSLNGYESSGIVRDQSNNTRIDTDESSFYPYASSSRRLSSDIFSDQQSQDSFFVTKNKPESSTIASQLDIIPEDSKMTTIDVTPSGELEECSTPEAPISTNDSLSSDSVFADKTTSLLNNGGKGTSKNVESPKLTPKVPKREENSDSAKKAREERMEKGLNKIASITEMLKKQSPKVSPEKKVSPGKLKPTLNINVNALLPGFSQAKIKSITKAQNSDQSKDTDKDNNAISPDDIETPTIRTGDSKSSTPVETVKSDQFQGLDVTDNVDILPSMTKERVRNPAKRKPSTRRARQEAIRSSVIEDNVNPDNITAIQPPKEKKSDDMPTSPPPQEPLVNISEPTGKSEKKPQSETPRLPLVTKNELEKKILRKKTNAKIDLFDSESESDDDGDLFKRSNRKTKVKVGSSDGKIKDSNDLFGSPNEKKMNTEGDSKLKVKDEENIEIVNGPKVRVEEKLKSVPKKSLFDDSSSDDDLFAGNSSNAGNKKSGTVTAASVNEKRKKSTSVKKLENVETEEDPLSSLLK